VTSVVIAGGGLAGAAAAAHLAQAGFTPLVLEREKAPRDKICGEFLSAEAQAHLGALGLDLESLGPTVIRGVRLLAGRRRAEAELPFVALGLSRRRLDAALLEHAERLGAKVERGVAVRQVQNDSLETSAGEIAAPRLLLASGKHDIRGARRKASRAMTAMLGFKSYFRLGRQARSEIEGFVEVALFEGGYAGLQMVEGGLANLCLAVQRSTFEAAGQTWPRLLARLLAEPHLARRLEDAEEVLPRPLAVADIPYGFTHQDPYEPPGLYRLGDQTAVIPSFCGNGMAIALHSARLAAEAIREGADAGAYHARLRRDVAARVRRAAWLQQRIDGWPGRRAAVWTLGLAPGLIPRLTAWTRISGQALRRAGLSARCD
jgi:flavin-dependent dehydrogenase